MLRKVAPFGAAVAAAFGVVAVARLTNWDSGAIYALGGFVGGVLVVAGTGFAFALTRFKDGDGMKPHESAVVAHRDEGGDTATNGHLVVSMGLDQTDLVHSQPAIVAAGWAVAARFEAVELPPEPFEIGHAEPV